MASRKRISQRTIWFQIHLWLGLTLGMVGIAVGVSGSILVIDHEIDEWLHPARYRISGSQVALPFAEYAARAAQALDGRAKPTGIRLPDGEEGPIMVFARPPGSTGFLRVYLDAPTGRVLDVTEGVDFIGWMHGFHENLMLRDYNGREIVGFVGVAMLISSLTGIYLWWPRRQWRKALGFRKGFGASRNLHYTFGFYGSIALALVSFTGLFLSFTDAGRTVVAWFGPLSPSPRGIQAPEGAGQPVSADDAVSTALAHYADARVTGVQLPNGPRGVYRIMLREAGDDRARRVTA
ncbi:MAG TPA: PepSY-associated TM helix domain-containing protein, partial [Burkholderiales bacterium]|nr:PepSY-associated TM helix domain-containing protein [Burkholderiales bacterium]